MMKFTRNDHPSGEAGAHGARWVGDERGDNVETYATSNTVRISVTDHILRTLGGSHAVVNLDPVAALEFAAEITRQAVSLLETKS